MLLTILLDNKTDESNDADTEWNTADHMHLQSHRCHDSTRKTYVFVHTKHFYGNHNVTAHVPIRIYFMSVKLETKTANLDRQEI